MRDRTRIGLAVPATALTAAACGDASREAAAAVVASRAAGEPAAAPLVVWPTG